MIRGLNLILRNSFRNTFRHPAKLIVLSALVALLALVLSLVVNINARVIDGYNSLRNQSNLHTVVMKMDPFDRVPTGDLEGFEAAPKNLVAAQQYWLYQLQNEYKDDQDKAFYWSRTEAREFSQVSIGSTALTLKVIVKMTPQNDLNQPSVESKNQQTNVDDLVVFSGRKMDTNIGHEVVVDNIFAQKHGLVLNDVIRIQSDDWGSQLLVGSPQNENVNQAFLNDLEIIKAELNAPNSKGINDPNGLYMKKYSYANDWYQIVGIGGSVDFTMPILNKSSPVPNRDTEGLLYVDSSVFGLKTDPSLDSLGFYYYNQHDGRLTVTSQNEWEGFYSLKNKNGKVPSAAVIGQMNSDFNALIKKRINSQTYFYGLNDKSYRYYLRTEGLQLVVKYYSIGITIILVLLLIVIIFSIALILEKQIDHSRGQVGILKALGYNQNQIVFNYIMTPIFTSVIGGIIGFAAAIPVTNLLVKEMKNYFVINYGNSSVNWLAFALVIVFFFIFLNAITFLITYLIVRKNTAELVSGQKHVKVSNWAQFWKSQVANRSFDTKLQTALLLGASGKMTLVGAIVLIATMLFTISFAGPDILRRNETASFNGVKYKQLVEYVEPVYNNPFTFYKTFNIEENLANRATYQWSDTLKTYTSLPLAQTFANGGYDLNQIASAYYNDTQGGEYYSLAVGKDRNGNIDVVNSNQRFLAGYDVAPSIEYYRFMSQWGVGYDSPGLGQILFNQWPDHMALMEQLKNPELNLKQNLKDFQYFYSVVVNGIGLSVTNWFWQLDPSGNPPTNEEKINIFNTNNTTGNTWANSKLAATKVLNYDSTQFNTDLTNLVRETSTNGEQFNLTNQGWGIGSYHIQPPTPVDDIANYFDDYYSLMNVDTLTDDQVNDYLKKMIVWYGALIEGRFDQAIIQAAYSRPAYFVQQSMKKAYNSYDPDPYIPYYQAFGVVPYNNKLEQYGVLFRAQDSKTKNGFKVYGVENNTQFLELRNNRDEDLIQKLYNSKNTDSDDGKIYNVIINKSIAKTLKLEKNSITTLDVLQQELTSNNVTSSLKNSWKIGLSPDNGTFKQLNSLSNAGWLFKTSGAESKDLQLFYILSGLLNTPGPYYKEFLDGKLRNQEISHPIKIKILDIHNGYGDKQAWIKNEDATEILNYSPLKEFFWQNFFNAQWNDTFATQNLNISNTQANEFIANDIFSFLSSDVMKTYSSFRRLLTDPGVSPEIKNSAAIIDQIYQNSFPLFNYKYSNKADVGDLSNAVSVFQAYGDYSPIAMNGITTAGKSIDGIAQGAMDTIVPISIKKAILSQISALVYLIMVLLIIAILLITFVIVLLTVNLIIDDNIQFIATMKVLGYSNNYIVKAILSMYFVVIAISFVIGFIAGWFAFVGIVHAIQPAVVLPLIFPIWLPIVVALGVGGIYAITLAVGYWTIIRTNPLEVLESQVT